MKNGVKHRVNGPAVEYHLNMKCWYQNGKLHRLDGPSVECHDGDKVWYYQGEKIKCNTQEEFERLIKLRLLW